MVVVVTRWRVTRPPTADEARRVEQEFVPLISGQPGFRQYFLARAGDQEAVAISVWDSREQAEAGLEKTSAWVQQTFGPIVAAPPERTFAEVIAHR
jgi:heme-degrading monooxygenase HmoA